MPRPIAGTFPPHFENYVSQVKEDDIYEAFKNQQGIIDTYFDSIPEEKTNIGYAEGKWSLKELMQHMIDTERVFAYRALCFARKDPSSLPSFDENDYAANSNGNARNWKTLCEEFKAVRKTTLFLFESFDEATLMNSGIANNKTATVMAMGFTSVGHVYHHKKIIEERYL